MSSWFHKNNKSHYAEKRILITGGSSGIGLALARQLAAAGAHVWLFARRPDLLQKAASALEDERRSPGQIIGWTSVDVSEPAAVERAVAQARAGMGSVDVLINSAGVAHPGYIQDLTPEIFREMVEINYLGTVHPVKAVLPEMMERKAGMIINISSLAGLVGMFGYSAYGASKFAVRGFSDALRLELKPLGIQVSLAYPPDTETPQYVYEQQFKPPETVGMEEAINLSSKPISSETVATEILKQAARGSYLIFPGADGKILFLLTSLAGPLTYPIIDWVLRRGVARTRNGQYRS